MYAGPDSLFRRRAALAVGAGALVLLGSAGAAYAASSIDVVETGWATVVDSDQTIATGAHRTAGSGQDARAGSDRDCPGYGSGSDGRSPSTDGSPQTSPDQDNTLQDEEDEL